MTAEAPGGVPSRTGVETRSCCASEESWLRSGGSKPAPLQGAEADSPWRVERQGVVESTMTLARDLTPWSAVVAEVQTGGRGQAQRSFISDLGGVYLTAVLPYAGDAAALRGFALAVGWGVRAELMKLGVNRLRLKWPNDLMIGARKVGGILVEQGRPDTLLVGVGLNVTNRPWQTAPELVGAAGALDQATGVPLPSRERILAAILAGIARARDEFVGGLRGFAPRLNECWGGTHDVELTLLRGQALLRGKFLEVDCDGGLRLQTDTGDTVTVAAHHVDRLREV